MKFYTMKDLGYKRTPTDAWYHVTMGDGSEWRVPVQAIVDNRDENYAHDEEDSIGFIRDGSLDSGNIDDWATNNMNWSDVQEYAERVESKPLSPPDYEDGWVNGDKRIEGTL